ncbi:phosphoribosyltransferase, partial [Patulibacter sp. S7RM1-6]
GAPEACALVAAEGATVVCPLRPRSLRGVGAWFADFGQTTDDEVRALLAASDRSGAPPDA